MRMDVDSNLVTTLVISFTVCRTIKKKFSEIITATVSVY